MINAVSLDQLRVFIAAAEEGSFSAAARQLRRAQSLISQTITNLENQLNVKLFDRTNKFPRLTDQGKVLMREAKTVIESMDAFKARAKGIAEGMEPELSVVIDAIYPMDKLTSAVDAFREIYPNVPLRIYVECVS